MVRSIRICERTKKTRSDRRTIVNNIELSLYAGALRDVIKHQHRLQAATVQKYTSFTNLYDGVHNIILEPRKDPKKKTKPVHFMIIDQDVEALIQEWLDEWRVPVDEEMDQGNH